MIKTGDIETRSLDLDAAGVDKDIQERVLSAAGSLHTGQHRFIADFIEAWYLGPETIRTEMRRPLSLDGISVRVGDAVSVPLEMPVMTPAEEINKRDEGLDAMASGLRHSEDAIRRSPSLSLYYAGHPLSDAERTLLHPDAERRRLNRELVTDVDDAARKNFSGAIAYLFGAVTDDPDYKRRFAAAQRYCERWGMTVLNPTRQPVTPEGPLPMEFYVRHGMIDVEACEVMIPVPSPFLEGSRGAAAERRYGECLQKPILDGFVKEV